MDTLGENWKGADHSQYEVVYHVAGIAHVNADPKMESLYYKANRDLALEIARYAKAHVVRQFIFMSSQIVFNKSQSLKREVLTRDTKENPNGFYGDSKWQVEKWPKELACKTFKVCILSPPMIYELNSKGNFSWMMKLAKMIPVFPAWHNKRSMCYIDHQPSLCISVCSGNWRARSILRTVSRAILWRLSVSLHVRLVIRFGLLVC